MKKYILILICILNLLNFNINAQQNILIGQASSVSVTDGDMFYDAGGSGGTDGNVSKTITLTPAVSGQGICIDFTSFKSDGKLEIFDGSTVTATNIGTFTKDFGTKYNAGTGAGQDVNDALAAELKPGIFCSNNASGTLTLKYTASGGGQTGWIGKIITHTISTGCNIQLTGNLTTICNGSSSLLTAVGTVGSPLLNNDFNASSIGTGWNSTPGGVSFLSVLSCEPNNGFSTKNTDNSVFAWMQSVPAPRSLETNGFDVSLGGYISFDFRMAADDNGGNGCELPDNKEGVYVQYSKNGGTWTTMKLMFPAFPGGTTVMGCGDYVFDWGNTSLPIPAGAFSANTKFRWYQNSATTSNEDSWGLDNVKIYANKTITLTISKDPTSPVADGTVLGTQTTSPFTLNVSPTTTTIYRARISDGISSCYQDITVTVSPAPTITTQPTPSTICVGTNTTFTVNATGGNGQYQWQVNTGSGFVDVSNGGVYSVTSSSTSSTLTITGATTSMNTYRYQCIVKEAVGTCPVISNAVDLTVNVINTIASGTSQTVCMNSAISNISLATTGATGANFNGLPAGVIGTWSSNLITISGTPTVSGPFNYTVTTTGGCPPATTTGTITVTPLNTIASGTSQSVCINDAISNISLATSGATGATFSGLPAGVTGSWSSNMATIIGIPTVSGPFNYTVTTIGGCPPATATGTITVTPNVTASVSITSSATNVCVGETLTFTATPTNGGTTPIYQWQVNGTNVGTNSAIFSSSTLSDGDKVKVIMTSNANCVTSSPATSNEITLTSAIVTASVSINADNNPVCAGANVTFTATPTNGGTNPTYQWKLNGNNIGTNNQNFSSTTLVSSDKIKVVMTSNGGCVTGSPATSNEMSISITPNLNASVSIIENKNSICTGTNVVFTATPTNEGTSPTYQWKLNGNDIGTGGNSFNSSNLSNNDVIKVLMTSNATCVIGSPATSNSITMIVSSSLTPSVSITSNNNICIGSQASFTAVPQNGGSSPIYQWKLNNTNVGTGGTTYSSSSLANNDIVTVQMISNINCVISNPAISNAITMVISAPKAPLFLSINSICENDIAPKLNTTSLDNPPAIGNWNPSIIDNKVSQSYTFTASSGCYSPVIMNVTVIKKPTLVIGTAPSGCAPKTVDLKDPSLTIGSTIGSTFQYWTNAEGTIPLTNPSAVGNGIYYISNTINGCSSTPTSVPVIINPIPIANFTPSPYLISTISPETKMVNESLGAIKYFWDFGDGVVSEEKSPKHIYSTTDTASYIITLIANSTIGCSDTISKKVKVYEELIYFVPNTFTPDQDNFNNIFQPVFVSGFDPFTYTMTIFNRWGELVFESNDTNIGWDGTYGVENNEIVKEGVYTWKIEFSLKSDDRRKQITGIVNLIK